MRFLGDEWFAALDAAARTSPTLTAAARELDLVIGQTVTTDDGAVTWCLVLHDGEARVVRGDGDPTPAITFTADRDTAVALARGDENAQTAFLSGRLRVAGDTTALVAAADVLGQVDDAFAAVRARTEW